MTADPAAGGMRPDEGSVGSVDDPVDGVLARFAAARVWAAHQAPYLASAVFALTPVVLEPSTDPATGRLLPDPDLAAFPADTRWRVHVDPATVLATPVEQTGWWLLHQVGHLVRGHAARSPARPAPGRTGPRDQQAHRWNQATDAEINDDLEADGLPGPDGVISPAALGLPEGRMAEEYLPMLDVLDTALHRGGAALAAAVDCGSGADGIDRSWDDTGSGGDGLTELEREVLERAIAAGIKERASQRSPVPGGWRRWADARLRPTVDWRARLGTLLRKGLTEASGKIDFSYRRPARRSAAHPTILLPSMIRPVPEIAVVIDTSGSVSTARLRQLLAEVGGILDRVGGAHHQLRVLCCDTAAHPVQTLHRGARDLGSAVELAGGGGTDLRVGIAAAAALRPRPDLVVVLTDGDTPWPERRPRPTVVVCLIGDGGQAPPWAASVHVKEDETR